MYNFLSDAEGKAILYCICDMKANEGYVSTGIDHDIQRTSPCSRKHNSVTRDYEYRILGTLSLLEGIDLHTGIVTEMVSKTQNSNDFVKFLKKLDLSYPEKEDKDNTEKP